MRKGKSIYFERVAVNQPPYAVDRYEVNRSGSIIFAPRPFRKRRQLGEEGRALVQGGFILITSLMAFLLLGPLAGIVILAVGASLRYWNPERMLVATLMATLLIPSRLAWNVGILIGPARIFLVALILTWLIYIATGRLKLSRTPMDVAILLFILIVLASILVNSIGMSGVQFNRSLKTLGYTVIEWFSLFYIATTVPRNWRHARKFIYAIMAMIAGISIVGVMEFVTRIRFFEWLRFHVPIGLNVPTYLGAGWFRWARGGATRIVATTISPHEVGLFMALTVPVVFYFLAYARNWRTRSLWMCVLLLQISSLALIVTRGAIVATLAGLLVMSGLSKKTIMRAGIAVVVTIALIGLMIFPTVLHAYSAVSSPTTAVRSGSVQHRLLDFPRYAAILSGRELLGVGYGQVTGHTLETTKINPKEHPATDDWYLSVLVETGYLGIGIIAMLWATIIYFMLKRSPIPGFMGQKARDLRIAILAGLVAVMVMDVTISAMAFHSATSLFWVMAGLGYALLKGERKIAQGKDRQGKEEAASDSA